MVGGSTTLHGSGVGGHQDGQGSSSVQGCVHTRGSIPTTFLRRFRRQRGKTSPSNRCKPNSQCPQKRNRGGCTRIASHPQGLSSLPHQWHPCDPGCLPSPGPERHGPVAGAHPPVRAATHHRVGHRWQPRGCRDTQSEFGHTGALPMSADSERVGSQSLARLPVLSDSSDADKGNLVLSARL